MNKNAIALPSLKKDTKLPVILNHRELKELFSAPTLLKQRIVLTLIYSAGLRGQEVINLKISDIDFEHKTIHIRQSKYKKDRIVPLAESMAIGLKKYLSAENPHIWLFNGKDPDGRYSVKVPMFVFQLTKRISYRVLFLENFWKKQFLLQYLCFLTAKLFVIRLSRIAKQQTKR